MSDADTPTTDPVAEIAAQAEGLLLAFRDPKVAAEHLVDWIGKTYPDHVSTAYWVTLTDHQQDKGVAIDVYRLPYHFRAKALVGGWSIGAGVFTDWIGVGGRDGLDNEAPPALRISVGVGAAAPYANLGKWAPVASVAVRF